ncbi:MAG: AAA family ATPase, partial [Clostridia bacterium]|nr:AAA family ATPase [Clostridia bacterium]
LKEQIEKRKILEAELKELKRQLPKPKTIRSHKAGHKFSTYVRMGETLKTFALQVKKYHKRDLYQRLSDYVFGEHQDKVFILYGLRRTGKTTLIRQSILDMTPEQLKKTAFIQIKSQDTLADINSDLRYLESQGYKYIFIDEVTLMEDFIEGASLFSDIYASSGMKIVLSGTDSLGFIFTEHEQLYDRCIMLHTTFIPYREFERVLGINGVGEFIRYGGTMSMSGKNYNENSSFATKKKADEYVDTAIAKNIQHSLKYYQDGGHFRHLYELFENNELTSAINRIVEDMHHKFTKQVLTRTYKSATLSLTANNLRKDRTESFELTENINGDFVLSSIKTMLDILEKEEQTVEIEDFHISEIKEYLSLLDLIIEIDKLSFPNIGNKQQIITISQPGLRYAQTKAVVEALMLDEKFNELSAVERRQVIDRVMTSIMGEMLEELVLLETKIANPKKEVFQLQFDRGEFDMVIFDSDTLSCEIFEIKHNNHVYPDHYVHLTDEKKCADTEHRFGKIKGKYVIYRGEPCEIDGIKYLNAEDYLKTLS